MGFENENVGDIREKFWRNLNVCPNCEFHRRIRASDYANILIDDGTQEELEVELRSTDGWRTARTSVHPLTDPAPTVLTPGPAGSTYILDGRADLLFAGTPVDTFTLHRL